MLRRRRVKEKSSSTKKKFPFLKILFYIVLTLGILYVIYSLFVIFSVKTKDITTEFSSDGYILSERVDSLKKTLIILEKGNGEQRRITDVYVYLTNPDKKFEIVIYLPAHIYYTGLEEKFGNEIAVSSFRYAGDFLEKGRGIEYAIWQINQLLGFKSDKYIFFSSEALEAINFDYEDSNLENIRNLNSHLGFFHMFRYASSLGSLDEKIYSNIPFYDIKLEIQNAGYGRSKYIRKIINLGEDDFLVEGSLVTGDKIKVLNTAEYDKVFRDLFEKVLDRGLENERVRVEVYNGSELTGVASSFGRKIVNTCCDVVRYGNAPNSEEKTKVYVSNMEKFSNAYRVVSDVIPIEFETVEGRPDFMTTGDIVVVLGKDIKSMYSF